MQNLKINKDKAVNHFNILAAFIAATATASIFKVPLLLEGAIKWGLFILLIFSQFGKRQENTVSCGAPSRLKINLAPANQSGLIKLLIREKMVIIITILVILLSFLISKGLHS